MPQELENYKIAIIIIQDSKRKKLAKFLNANNFNCHFGLLGKGTAPTDISAIWGLSETDKSLFLTVIKESQSRKFFNLIDKEFHLSTKAGHGIAFTIPISSVAHLNILNFMEGITRGDKANG